MENVTLEKAARILDTTEDVLNSFPKDITEEMLAVMEMVDTNSEEECQQLYQIMKTLWVRGTNYNDMKNISDRTGIDFDMLMSLDDQAQLMIDFEYTASNFDAAVAQKCFREAIQVRDLPEVAKLTETELDLLKSFPRDIQEQLCGAYLMEFDDDGDNSELISELKTIISDTIPY